MHGFGVDMVGAGEQVTGTSTSADLEVSGRHISKTGQIGGTLHIGLLP